MYLSSLVSYCLLCACWAVLPSLASAQVQAEAEAKAETETETKAQSALPKRTDYRYGVAEKPWDEELGNHRAVLRLPKAQSVRLDLTWRRHDANPEAKQFIIINADTGERIKNIDRLSVTPHACSLNLAPVEKEGTYYFYYLPYTPDRTYGKFKGDYLPSEQKDSPSSHSSQSPQTSKSSQTSESPQTSESHGSLASLETADLPRAEVVLIESRTALDSFYPMEVVASPEETVAYMGATQSPFLVFPEDRYYSIRTRREIPVHWLNYSQEKPSFSGMAERNEYYCYQIGVLAKDKPLKNLKAIRSDLKGTLPCATIPSTQITCFNTEGINARGEAFTKELTVPENTLQALWFGIDVPETAIPDTYTGTVTLSAEGLPDIVVPITLTVEDSLLPDRGDNDPYRMSRLRWLNSTIGINDTPTAPYTNIEKKDKTLHILGRSLNPDAQSPLPAQIKVGDLPLLSSPIRFIVETSKGIKPLNARPSAPTLNEGSATWTWTASDPELTLTCKAHLEFDGRVNFTYTLTPNKSLDIKDIRIEIPMAKEVASYFMGAGVSARKTPSSFTTGWEYPSEDGSYTKDIPIPVPRENKAPWPFDSFWLGNTQGGLHCEFRGADYTGPLLYIYGAPYPEAWYNNGKGGFTLRAEGDTVTATAFSGERTLEAQKPLVFEFALLITPVKPLDFKAQFTNRYLHSPNVEQHYLDAHINTINIHHATDINPIINYPFLTADRIKTFRNTWAPQGIKTKIYYTVRELTTALPELWAFRSLGHELFTPGDGGGFPWMREHMVDDYYPLWYSYTGNVYPEVTGDASIKVESGETRLLNFYVEGLAWLVKNADIDGLYLDDVAYDRNTLKRMRRAMEAVKPDCILDLHADAGPYVGASNQYAEFFPYIDKVWFGEYYDYDKVTPENWLVEVSGIPFGITGDMLQSGGNRWLGMQYGMTLRPPWETHDPALLPCSPVPVWHLWDDFGIADADVIGFWDKNNPVTPSSDLVKATVYCKPGKTLVSLGNYSDTPQTITLALDAKALGLKPDTLKLTAPAVKDFQEAQSWQPGDTITLPPRKGLLIYVE